MFDSEMNWHWDMEKFLVLHLTHFIATKQEIVNKVFVDLKFILFIFIECVKELWKSCHPRKSMDYVVGSINSDVIIHGLLVDEAEVSEDMLWLLCPSRSLDITIFI